MASLEEINDGAYPMFFGVSCAFVALHLMSRTRRLNVEDCLRSRAGELMLQGSAQLLGLLVDRAQKRGEAIEEKLKKAELEVGELKRRRAEDAKANEKVVGIFAAHEQSWIAERRKLGLRIQALFNELRTGRAKNEANMSEVAKRIEEYEHAIQCKDEALEDEAKKRTELEEKLQIAHEVTEELRERAMKEAQDHSAELWKHKTAFVEIVSSQRQLEAEMGRALRQVETLKQEVDEAGERKEEAVAMVEKLSGELVKLQRDAEQKDKILSAMLRKSKLDTAEKQLLLKEVKMAKAKKKQAEMEMERWRNVRELRHRKGARAMHSLEAGCSQERSGELQHNGGGYNPKTLLLEYLQAESRKEHESTGGNTITASDCFDQCSSEGNDELAPVDDIQQLKDWVRMETEKYAAILEQRHYAEIDAFTEQMRLKDEKLEVLSWRLLNMELESKRLQSHIEGLDGNLSQFREENIKLEALLVDREKELKASKEQFTFHLQHCQKINSLTNPQVVCSEVKITKRKPREKEQETKAKLALDSQKTDKNTDTEDVAEETKLMQQKSQNHEEPRHRASAVTDIASPSSVDEASPTNHILEHSIVCIDEQWLEEPEKIENLSEGEEKSPVLTTQNLKKEIEEEKEVGIDPGHFQTQNNLQEDTGTADKLSSPGQSFLRKDSTWKMDIHALGVSYKIKRLKQQLLVLEKLVAAQAMQQTTCKDDECHAADWPEKRKFEDNSKQIKGLLLAVSLLNKQVQRYQSLEEKTDDLCRRMHENSRTESSRGSQGGRTKKQTEALQGFLEETFQLQRFMVATGQKLMEVQSRIAASFVCNDGLDESAGFNIGQFSDVVRTLFRDIQRGLEVRIARIIGDLEGTLAYDGILR